MQQIVFRWLKRIQMNFSFKFIRFFGINSLWYSHPIELLCQMHKFYICLFNWTNDLIDGPSGFLNFHLGICFDFGRDFERCRHIAQHWKSIEIVLYLCECVCKSMSIGEASMWGILYELARSHALCMDDSYIRSNYFFFRFAKLKSFFSASKMACESAFEFLTNISMKQ